MKRLATLGHSLLLWALLAPLAGSQPPSAGAAQGQARPGAVTPAAGSQVKEAAALVQGTARIAGHVASTDGRPLRGAQVSVRSTALRRTFSARTDATGAFEVKALPAGEYTLMASKSGYVGLFYGAKRGGGAAGRPVRVADGQLREKIDFELPRACVIVGRVLDEFGEPAGEAGIEPLKPMVVDGKRRLVPVDFGKETNDLGDFRLHGLDPGDYFVRATLRPDTPPTTRSEDHSAYPPFFYPGVTSVDEATRVPCRAGQETPGVHISLRRVNTVSVSGSVIDGQGRPATAIVRMMPLGDIALNTTVSAMPLADGSFTLTNVVAGTYRVFAYSSARTPAEREMASTTLSVGGRDVEGLVLQLSRGATARGRVVPDGEAAFDFPMSRVRLMSSGGADDFSIGFGSGTVKEDGSFELTGLVGEKRLQVANLPDTWVAKAIRTKTGTDAMEQPVAFHAGETLDGFEIVLTNKVAVLQGGVTDERNRPVKDYAVGVFSENPDHWGLARAGRALVVRSDQDGRFQLRGLLPGRYFAVAMSEIDADDWMDNDYLERLRSLATPVTITEGETKSLDLKLVGQS